MAPKVEGMNSTIGEGSFFEGKFYISGSLRIDGKFEGEIKTDDELVIGEKGRVKTDIYARSVVVAGTVIGNINAEQEVRLLETAKVLGDITAPAISIQRGVVAQGQIIITGAGPKRDPKKFIEEFYNGQASPVKAPDKK
ncbi:MAG TPA: polymer-forming cytoskeletal protein [Spirochaetota bacterium]|jgi:cytoskeletal protein CcmA (bactofilin family)|nr:MAG: Polymer-forming cytoskeletal [Spirochaetes bacterium ADurb.Bin218]HON15525.1 polymer-forming cytoskeletal protein [Spirochaetota bacterium]HOQ11521.1 polymer-forming cytoskeletal protein [Spirochaetota bacterium]HOV09868.1 polymer-forming cytoskeletal protein [Spirochaetota bacterium]HPX92174.1 polymer-forming cytoskeletal protein [Spirochaetota bacterium]